MIDDDIYNRIIEFKANVVKKIWRDKYVHEHHAYDKNNARYVNMGFFPQQIDLVSL